MNTAVPKPLRPHIGIFGRTNVGKSSFLNMVTGQEVAVTSPVAGTTTDVVEKPMELLPFGPVLFLDTGGLDDVSLLGPERIRRARAVFDRCDLAVLVVEPDTWTAFEDAVVAEVKARGIPALVVVNKGDRASPLPAVREAIAAAGHPFIVVSSMPGADRERFVPAFVRVVEDLLPQGALAPATILGDLVPPGRIAVLVVPIDLGAPKGRLILPQVQAIRDLLDSDAAALVVKEREYAAVSASLALPPAIVVCDSQVVQKTVADTPPAVPCTTFSILFARLRGDLAEAARGAAAIGRLKDGDCVLIAEACTHHALEDDIGRVKLPRMLRQYSGADLSFDVAAGHDYPEDLGRYALIVHCGGCMINRRAMLTRMRRAREAQVPVTNYGVCIAAVHGVLDRVLAPFPAAAVAYKSAVKSSCS